MQLISKFNKAFRFLLYVIDIFSKYAWVAPLKDKKGASIVTAFQKILDDSDRSEAKSKGCKPNKIQIEKGSEFYNNFFKKWLKVRNTVRWTYVINDLNGEEIIGTFYEKELQKTNQKDFRIEKVLKRKGDKLYVLII